MKTVNLLEGFDGFTVERIRNVKPGWRISIKWNPERPLRQSGHLYCILRSIFFFVYLIFHTPAQSFFVLQQRILHWDSADGWFSTLNKTFRRGEMGYSLNIIIYLLFDLCSMSVILLKSMKVMSGSESSMRKEMEQDCAGTWGDCGDDGKHCRTGQSQELNCSAYMQLEAMVNILQRPSTGRWPQTCPMAPCTAADPRRTQCSQQKLQGWLKIWKKVWCTQWLCYTIPGVVWD